MPGQSCKNCDQALPAQAAFCPTCGQSVKQIDRPWLAALRELLTELFDFDGRMSLSFRLLMTRPGFLTREYILGRRARYTSPIRMYLVISLLFFFVLPMILPDTTATLPDHQVSVDLYSQAMFLMLPVFALLLKLFYRQTWYLAHLISAVHLFSLTYIVFAVILSIEVAADRYLGVLMIQLVFFLYLVIYYVVALRVTYQQGWWKSIFKFLGLFLIFLPIVGGMIELVSHSNIFTNM